MSDKKHIVELHGERLTVELLEYASPKNTAIRLNHAETGEPWVTATVNTEQLKEGEVAIKDYSENAGVLQTLINAKVVSKPKRYTLGAGIPVCDLLIQKSCG